MDGKKMAEKDQTLKETPKEETSKETAKEKETPKEEIPEKKPTEPEVDYKDKFRESQKEAMRLRTRVKDLEKEPKKEDEAEKEAETIDQIVEKKVKEEIAPLKIKDEKERVDKWLDKNPEAYDYLQSIEDTYPDSPGKNIEEKLENALLIAKKDVMKEAGKKEMAFAIYQKKQAVASGGGASSSTAESMLPSLSAEEKKVATAMGLTEEAYAKRKLESTKK